jgi:hypothetical protein
VASDIGLGDSEVPYVDVSPADLTTAATLTVTAPDGTVTPTAATVGDLVEIPGTSPTEYTQRWTAVSPVTYSAAGRWVLHWDVAGTGEGAEDLEVFVVPSPVAGGPTWWPGRSRVAAYIPHRTLQRSVSNTIGSQDEYEMTFGSQTIPTGIVCDRLIADGAAWVTALVTPLATTSEPLASLLCALHAAIAIERSWPDDDQSLQRANDMEKQLNTMLAQLIAANGVSTSTGDYGLDIAPAPAYSFPCADPRWDYPTYW